MADKCEIEVSGIGVVNSCPEENELILFSNVEGGLGEEGYANRTWLTLINCIKNNMSGAYLPRFHQELTEGDEMAKTITAQNGYSVVDDSVSVVLDGQELIRYTDETASLEYIMYTVSYSPATGVGAGTALITFYNAGSPLPAGRVIIIKYGIRLNL